MRLFHSTEGGSIMLGKKALIAAIAVGTLGLMATGPASAAGLFLPWILGRHVVGAVLGLATLPLAVASSMAQPMAPYPSAPGYGGTPGYGARPSYYPGPSAYYSRPPAYYAGPSYYRPPVSYPRSAPRFYEPARGYSAARTRYTGGYGAHVPNQPGRFAYRRR
jgi:hypothetical protein